MPRSCVESDTTCELACTASRARHATKTGHNVVFSFSHTVFVLLNCISRHLGAALARRIRSTDVSVGQREEEEALDWMRQEVIQKERMAKDGCF